MHWQVLKGVRLRALQDSPHAFMSCYDTVVALAGALSAILLLVVAGLLLGFAGRLLFRH